MRLLPQAVPVVTVLTAVILAAALAPVDARAGELIAPHGRGRIGLPSAARALRQRMIIARRYRRGDRLGALRLARRAAEQPWPAPLRQQFAALADDIVTLLAPQAKATARFLLGLASARGRTAIDLTLRQPMPVVLADSVVDRRWRPFAQLRFDKDADGQDKIAEVVGRYALKTRALLTHLALEPALGDARATLEALVDRFDRELSKGGYLAGSGHQYGPIPRLSDVAIAALPQLDAQLAEAGIAQAGIAQGPGRTSTLSK